MTDHDHITGGPAMFQRVSIIATFIVAAAATGLIIYRVAVHGPGIDTDASRHYIEQTATGKQPLLIPTQPFALTDIENHPFDSEAQLADKVWVVNFFFTRCRLICPIMMSATSDLQDRLQHHPQRAAIRLVSISVDGEHDTPAVLKPYATGLADPGFWHVLTGPREVTWPLAEQTFKLALEEDPTNELMPIAHSSRFVLVDRKGRIYNYYDSQPDDDHAALLADIDRALEK